jgi:exopolyphosphatase / guanosine-5'-triphosphate,3'-diphosphate pyrophosphatase
VIVGRVLTRVAAVDCGTNSIRLLVADVGPDGELHEVDRQLTIVRLGQGVDRTGEFAPEALRRTFVACDNYASAVREHRVERLRFVATSAARDVGNADELFAGVRSCFGVDPEIISGDEEARLSFAGATSGLADMPAPYLVVDLGGGSTELVLGDRDGVWYAESLDLGSVRTTERYLHSDPATPDEIAAASAAADSLLAATTVPVDRARSLIGVAGTITTVAAVALNLPEYDRARVHHARIAGDLLSRSADWLLTSTRAERAGRRAIHPGRVDVIGAGAMILDRLHRMVRPHLATDELLVSEHDILDGLALALAD